MNKRIEISVNQEDVQNIIDCYEKDIKYIKQLEAKVNQLEEENKQIKERIEYYYEFDEELKKEDLPEELRPYYKNQDCCRYIVELRKENKELQQKVNQLETNRDELKKWLISMINANEHWYNEELTIHDKKYYSKEYQITNRNFKNVKEKIDELERGKE